jgi:hypothetical protein
MSSLQPAQFSSNFLERIEARNREKPNAPLALVLQATFDPPPKAFCEHSAEELILKISEVSYRVIIEYISSGPAVGATINSVATKYEMPISLAFIFAHGDSEYMVMGPPVSDEAFFKESDLHEDIFSGIHPNGEILIASCKIGRGKLIKKMVNIGNRVIVASKGVTSASRMYCTHFPGMGLQFSYLDENPQDPNLLMFRPNASPEPLHFNNLDFKGAFTERLDYFKKCAEISGEGEDFFEVAKLIGAMWPLVYGAENRLEFFRYVTWASAKKHPGGHYWVGACYLQGNPVRPSSKKAEGFFKLARERGYEPPPGYTEEDLKRNLPGI